MAIDIDKNISQLIANQFPDFYKEEGELFIAFVKAYYEWLESETYIDKTDPDANNWVEVVNESAVLHNSRKLPEYRDIDKTIEAFILDFKNKYLSDIQFNVATNKRLFVKNALEFYRAKGTPRAIDLFFKLVYGLEAKTYLPSDDLFRLSDNSWTNERYLEIKADKSNINFVGKTVFGSVSGASAYAEKLIRVKSDTKFIEVLYLSGLNGEFQTDELIYAYEDLEIGDIEYRNKVIGSLTTFEITSSDPGFEVGETVYVKRGSGKKAKAVVTAVQKTVGIVDFNFVHGGWGYSQDTNIISSDKVLTLKDVEFTNNGYYYHNAPFRQFGIVKQDLARFEIAESDTTTIIDLQLGDVVQATVGDVEGANVVWEASIADKSIPNNYLVLNYTKSDYSNTADGVTLTDDGRELTGNTLFTTLYATSDGNTVSVPINNAEFSTDVSVNGNVISVANTLTVQYTTTDSGDAVERNELFYQYIPNTDQVFAVAEIRNAFTEATDFFFDVQMQEGYFRSDLPLYRATSNTQYDIVKLSNVVVGLIAGTTGTELNFRAYANTYSSNAQLGTVALAHANNTQSTFATRAAFRPSGFLNTKSYFSYETEDREGAPLEINEIGLDTIIQETANVDAADPGNSAIEHIASGNTIGYVSTLLEDALNYTQTAISLGSISSIVVTSPGESYGGDPLFIGYDPLAYHTERYDFYIKYKSEGDDDVLKAFQEGEIIQVGVGDVDTKAKIFKFSQSTREIWATRLSFTGGTGNTELFWTTDDFRINDTIVGQTSGIAAVIEEVDELRRLPRTGLNLDVTGRAISDDGFATEISVIDSGFGYTGKRIDTTIDQYVKGEEMVLASIADNDKEINAIGYLAKQGVAPGIHPSRRSFLSSDKYLHDNDFYQEYSYQVLTALPFTKYKNTLIDVLHLAGSKPFGGYLGTSIAQLEITPTQTTSTFNIKRFNVFVNENTFYSNTVVST